MKEAQAPAAQARLETVRFGVTLFLVADAMLFAGLVGAVIVLRSGAAVWSGETRAVLTRLVLAAACGALGGMALHWARPKQERGMVAIALAAFFLALVLGGKAFGFPAAGFSVHDLPLSASVVLALAGFQAFHLALIVLLLLLCLFLPARMRPVWFEAAALGGFFVAGTGLLIVGLLCGLRAGG
jgi:heme/copper-type cytochrome/quinol oxidase subunit 3